jgi:hypothetical protein
MCNNVSLPPVGYAEQLIHNLRTVNDPGEDVSADVDIETAAMNDLPIDNNFIAFQEEEIGEIAHRMNAHGFSGVLVDYDFRNLVRYEYDEIFSGYMPRRPDRDSRQPAEPHRALIKQWLDDVHSRDVREDAIAELGDPDSVPDQASYFSSMIRHCLPARLDYSSWVGGLAKQKLLEDNSEAFSTGELTFWQQWMGPGFVTEERKIVAMQSGIMPFVGEGGKDRLVWREDPFGSFTSMRPDIEILIAETEQGLVRLSIQIANWLAWSICKHHVMPMARMRRQAALTSGDIIQAVVEILGDAWFELPFDDDDKLKAWKFNRVFPWDLEDYLLIVNDHDDEGGDDGGYHSDEWFDPSIEDGDQKEFIRSDHQDDDDEDHSDGGFDPSIDIGDQREFFHD